MAKSNSTVATDFIAGKSSHGSNFRSEAFGMDTGVFHIIAQCYSYSTMIARVVRNKTADRNELWLCPQFYSQTTARHKSHITSAWASYCRDRDISTVENMYPTINRVDHHASVTELVETLPDVNKPRIRDATRRGVVQSCLHRLDMKLRVATSNVPAEHWHPAVREQWGEAVALRHTLMDWLTLPVPEMRATVAGYLALNDIKAIY
jgi:hypothetical protein